ncbi:hypothetical protein J3F83DRAFT_528087 [Trichoderma novae-zelandiae]
MPLQLQSSSHVGRSGRRKGRLSRRPIPCLPAAGTHVWRFGHVQLRSHERLINRQPENHQRQTWTRACPSFVLNWPTRWWQKVGKCVTRPVRALAIPHQRTTQMPACQRIQALMIETKSHRYRPVHISVLVCPGGPCVLSTYTVTKSWSTASASNCYGKRNPCPDYTHCSVHAEDMRTKGNTCCLAGIAFPPNCVQTQMDSGGQLAIVWLDWFAPG